MEGSGDGKLLTPEELAEVAKEILEVPHDALFLAYIDDGKVRGKIWAREDVDMVQILRDTLLSLGTHDPGESIH